MATIVLTAVGGLVGGPVGAALGAMAGQRIDSAILAPTVRQGPRLGDLSIQTSSYGTSIPKIFGTMRVAGTVIWATDIQEHKSRSGGGKGRPKTESYSYSTSFAVALSGRPIRSVLRIWADGKLLRGAAGDFKSQTEFRLYLGTEDQPVDPRIAAEEGIGRAPAHRGVAYAMFEDFQLADYGNHIPSLTFEVEADAAPVTIGTMAEQLTEGELRGGETEALAGYAAIGDSLRGALEPLGEIFPLSLLEQDEAVVFSEPQPDALPIDRADLAVDAPGGTGAHPEFSRSSAAGATCQVSIAYHDPERDFQTSLQRARRGPATARSEQIPLPAVLTADRAKSLAERRLEQLWTARRTGKVQLITRCANLRPGALVNLSGEPGIWKIARWSLERMLVKLELTRASLKSAGVESASPGRPVSERDRPHGPTTLVLLDLPPLGEEPATRPQVVAIAAGADAGWRGAALIASFDGGTSWVPQGSTAAPGIVGRAINAAGPGGSLLFDERTAVDVELLNEGMWLESRSDASLAAGANLATLGDELVQFGRVQPLGPRKFRLSRLLRGRRGTEWATGSHAAGEPFALIEREALAILDLPAGFLSGEIRVAPQGIGDPVNAPAVAVRVVGNAVAPPAPVHFAAERRPSGDIELSWVRRSRVGWAWTDGMDAPLAEESEAYRVTLSGSSFGRVLTVSEARFTYKAAQQAADGLAGPLHVEVAQIGTCAASRIASITV
jgi:hypothetical protein